MPNLILVAGLGRCGSSLMMQMLAASGLKCAGRAPMYETDWPWNEGLAQNYVDADGGISPEGCEWAAKAEGWLARHQAAKYLSPHLFVQLSMPGMVVWLDRDPLEQASSQVKWMRAMGDPLAFRPDAVALFQSRLALDRASAIHALVGRPRIEVTFEHILRAPMEASEHVAEFAAEFGMELDPARMAAVVRDRGVECAAGLEIRPHFAAGSPMQ